MIILFSKSSLFYIKNVIEVWDKNKGMGKIPILSKESRERSLRQKGNQKTKKASSKNEQFWAPPKKNLKNLFKNKFTRDIMQLFSADTKIFFF